MTSARRVGHFPTRPVSFNLGISHTPALACAGVLAALNAQADQFVNALTWQAPMQALLTLGGVAAVIWFAMYAALRISFEDARRPLDRNGAAIVAATIFLSVVPFSYAAQAGLLLCAAYLFMSSRPRDPARRVSLILLALTGPLIWGRLFLLLFGAQVLSLDAHIAGAAIGTNVQGNIVHFAGQSGAFLVGGPCSSIHNISLAIILWTTAAAIFDLKIDRLYAATGGAMIALMFALNSARLSAMGQFPADFDFLHIGLGAELFGWAALIGAGSLAFMGVSGAVRRQR